MTRGRAVEAILAEWREAERMLADVPDSVTRSAIQARVEVLREEHRLALAARQEESAELATL